MKYDYIRIQGKVKKSLCCSTQTVFKIYLIRIQEHLGNPNIHPEAHIGPYLYQLQSEIRSTFIKSHKNYQN